MTPPTPLRDHDVHAWRIELLASPERLDRALALLNARELTRADRFFRERDRRRFAISRYAVRTILSTYLDCDSRAIAFEYGEHGKPAIDGSPVEFNLTHSEDLAYFAVARRPVGIDLEYAKDRAPLDVAERYFAPDEHRQILELPSDRDRTRAFFLAWTRKEAYLKACGAGLSSGLAEVSVTLRPGDPPRLLSLSGDARAAERWTLFDLSVEPGFAGAVVVEDRAELHYHDFAEIEPSTRHPAGTG